MSDRDELAALIVIELKRQNEEGREGVYVDADDLSCTCIDGWVDLRAIADALIKAGWREPEPNPCAHTSQSRVGDTSQWICNQCGDVDERGGAYA